MACNWRRWSQRNSSPTAAFISAYMESTMCNAGFLRRMSQSSEISGKLYQMQCRTDL